MYVYLYFLVGLAMDTYCTLFKKICYLIKKMYHVPNISVEFNFETIIMFHENMCYIIIYDVLQIPENIASGNAKIFFDSSFANWYLLRIKDIFIENKKTHERLDPNEVT